MAKRNIVVRRVHLNRALSKLGILTRSQATEAVLNGRVSVDEQIVRDPAALVDLASARIAVDGRRRQRASWRTILLHKPRGVVTTRSDPDGRRTVYDIVGVEAAGLVPVGRLDAATSGLLLMTTDTELAGWLTDPMNAIPRVYVVTVRGRVAADTLATLERGVVDRGETLQASAVQLRKASARESHLTVELREGKNREVRRLFRALGHDVTRLKRVRFGTFELDHLAPGAWRSIARQEIAAAFPDQPRRARRKV